MFEFFKKTVLKKLIYKLFRDRKVHVIINLIMWPDKDKKLMKLKFFNSVHTTKN